jgi:hypothetical protein
MAKGWLLTTFVLNTCRVDTNHLQGEVFKLTWHPGLLITQVGDVSFAQESEYEGRNHSFGDECSREENRGCR